MDYSEEFRKIRRQFRINENGSIAESMDNLGIKYKLNYGVSVMKIKELAEPYEKDNELANYLWEKDIREAKLFALHIFDTQTITPDELNKIVFSFTNGEQVEQACMHIFHKLPFAIIKAKEFCLNESEFVKMTGYILLARLLQMNVNIQETEIISFFEIIENDATDLRVHIKKAISRVLRIIGRKKDNLRNEILLICEKLEKSDNQSSKWIAEDVKLEFEYL